MAKSKKNSKKDPGPQVPIGNAYGCKNPFASVALPDGGSIETKQMHCVSDAKKKAEEYVKALGFDLIHWEVI